MALSKFTAALALTAGLALAAGGALAHEGHQGPPPKTPGGKAAWARHDNFKAQGAAFERAEAEQRQARSRERKAQQQLVHKLEKEIAALEKRQHELTAELERPETYQTAGRAMEINRELLDIVDRLKPATAEWESAAGVLAELENA